MNRLRHLLVPLAFVLISGCATGGGSTPPAMPAARQSLQPEFRLFYDALTDYGDWVLIEPYGFVFRPRVDYLTWRPYTNGFWAASDSYGWVWVSAESFGWATEHYGRWLWDDYQGWVWVPGVDWGPAWVTWQMGGAWVGWSALTPLGMPASGSRMPGGAFVYAPVQNLGSSNISTGLVTRDALGSATATLQPVRNPVERSGVRIDLGPPIAQIEQVQGRSLPRVRLEDVLPQGGPSASEHDTAPADSIVLPTPAQVKSAADDAARITKQSKEVDAPASGRVPMVRPFGTSARPAPPANRAPKTRAAPDTSHGGKR